VHALSEAEAESEAEVEVDADSEEELDAESSLASLSEQELEAAEAAARAEVEAAEQEVAEAEELVTRVMRAEPKKGETEAEFLAGTVRRKQDCRAKCARSRSVSFVKKKLGLSCVKPCEECLSVAHRTKLASAGGGLRWNTVALRCYANDVEQARDSWRRYKRPDWVPFRADANRPADSALRFAECPGLCQKLYPSGVDKKANKKCRKLCKRCVFTVEYPGGVHFHGKDLSCHAFDYELVMVCGDSTSRACRPGRP
jgi:hypothetical protein